MSKLAKYWLIDMGVNAVLGIVVVPCLGRLSHSDMSTPRLVFAGIFTGALLAFGVRWFGGRLVAPLK